MPWSRDLRLRDVLPTIGASINIRVLRTGLIRFDTGREIWGVFFKLGQLELNGPDSVQVLFHTNSIGIAEALLEPIGVTNNGI